ncbi:MAG TPA: substrate-binding domain-containing protein [Caproicibacter sp.]|nr:substrate-binding domain-containing protein [Caproicibacter sp.]
MKKFLAVLLVFAMVFSLGACSSTNANSTAPAASGAASTAGAATTTDNSKIKIGVSIWSSTDVLGSQCKKMLDAAGKALGVQLMYVDQGHESSAVTDSINTLCAGGCNGIIVCNSADSEMTSCINTCNQAKVYLAQFFRIISKDKSPQIYSMAQSAPYYVGAVHEDEVTNGYTLANILINKGKRNICLEGWVAGDATFLGRWQGYKKAVDEWNTAHPSDKVTMTEPQYAGTTAEQGASVAKSFMNSNSKMDSLIVAGGGGDPLVGSIGAIKSAGKTGKIAVVSTDFLPDLGQQLATGGMTAESGGHYCDPLYAFMMVYNSIKGKYKKPANDFLEIKYPYLYVASKADYDNYAKYFVAQLPYNDKELQDMGNDTFDQLSKQAAAMSIKDVQTRHG